MKVIKNIVPVFLFHNNSYSITFDDGQFTVNTNVAHESYYIAMSYMPLGELITHTEMIFYEANFSK